jgi:hypothetical protein
MIAACSRPVAWANWRVSGDTPPVDESGDSALGGSFFNYTPFPSGVTLALTAEYSTWVRLEKPGPISLRIMKPLAHFKREIELRDVRATDPIDIVR